MSQVAEAASRRYFEKSMIEASSDTMNIILRYSEMLSKHKIPDAIWFGQSFRSEYQYWNILQFARLHTMMLLGEISFIVIDINHYPLADKEVIRNTEILDKNLPEPFTARFTGGYGENDGNIYWNKDISLSVVDYEGKEHGITMKPGGCSFEVGFTEFETSYFHLFSRGALARWPHECNYIVVMSFTYPHKWIDT